MKTFFVTSLAIVLILLSLSSCKNDLDEGMLVELYYNEKACVDIWEKTNVKQYLAERGIHPTEIKRKWVLPDDAMLCKACYCPSGWGIFIKYHRNK
jgi:hypothetical protein